MDEQDKLRQARIASQITRARQQKATEEANRAHAEQSFIDAWEPLRRDVVAPTMVEYATGLATHDIDHEVADAPSARQGVKGMTLRIGPDPVVAQPKQHVLFTMMPDPGAARVQVSYDQIPNGKVIIGYFGLNQITAKNVAGWLNDAFEKGGYAG